MKRPDPIGRRGSCKMTSILDWAYVNGMKCWLKVQEYCKSPKNQIGELFEIWITSRFHYIMIRNKELTLFDWTKKHIFLGCCGCCLPFTPVDFDGWGIIWPNGRWKAMSPYVFAWSRAMTRRENPRPKVLCAAFTPSNFYLRDLSKVDTSKMTEVYSSRWTRFPQNLRLSSQKLQTGCSEIQVLLSTYDLDKDDKAFIFARVWYNVCIIVMYLFIHIHVTIYTSCTIYVSNSTGDTWPISPQKHPQETAFVEGETVRLKPLAWGSEYSWIFPFRGNHFLLNYFAYIEL